LIDTRRFEFQGNDISSNLSVAAWNRSPGATSHTIGGFESSSMLAKPVALKIAFTLN
jgi:hypothetical protein